MLKIPTGLVLGAGAGAIELVGGAGTLAGEMIKATGVGANKVEMEESRRVLGEVAASITDLGHLAAVLLRKDEYVKAFSKDSDLTVATVVGKHVFDVASALLGGAALKSVTGIGATGAKMAVETTGSAVARVGVDVGEAGLRTVGKETLTATAMAGATAVGVQALEESVGGGLKGVIRRFAAKAGEEAVPTAKEVAKEVAKESPKEGVKEMAKGSGHKVEAAAHGDIHGETAQSEGPAEGAKHS